MNWRRGSAPPQAYVIAAFVLAFAAVAITVVALLTTTA